MQQNDNPNDKDKFSPEEENQYHFSEDESHYEAHPEATVTPPQPPESRWKQFLQRRIVIGSVVFLVLIFGVYKMLAPTRTTPTTDIAPTVTQAQVPAPQAPVATMPGVIPVNQPGTTPSNPVDVMNTNNTQLAAKLQATFEEKVAQFTEQTQLMQKQIDQLNTRLGVMETQLNQMVQVLLQKQLSAPNPVSPAAQQSALQEAPAPRLPYSVQAIIPGRAWLKGEGGETVTVAEGDTLKNAGKIVKVDPYEGVVEINTGRRVISLSYGTTG